MSENTLMKFFFACLSAGIAGLWWEVDKPLHAALWSITAAVWVWNGISRVRYDRLVARQRQEWQVDR